MSKSNLKVAQAGKAKGHVLGFPRMGANRQLKWALEDYWSQAITQSQLIEEGQNTVSYTHLTLPTTPYV